MKLLLFTASIFVFGCSVTTSSPVTEDPYPLQQIQQEVEQLQRRYEESIVTYDEKIANLEQELSTLRTLVPQSVDVPVAFSVRLDQDTSINDSPIVFGIVNLNIGDGYDEFTGGFHPPVGGVYVLTFYGLVVSTNGGSVHIKRNDDILCSGFLDDNNPVSTSTCTAIAELTTEDSVRVTGDSGNLSELRGDSW